LDAHRPFKSLRDSCNEADQIRRIISLAIEDQN
jgi:hypothetical protein